MELYILRCSITVFQINPVFRELSMLLLLLPWSPCALLADHGKLAHYIVASLTTLRLSRLLCVALQHILHSVSAWGMSPSFNVSVTWWKSPTCCCGAVVCLQSLRLSVMVTVSALFLHVAFIVAPYRLAEVLDNDVYCKEAPLSCAIIVGFIWWNWSSERLCWCVAQWRVKV